MSLTSLIECDKELRDKIKQAFPIPKLDKNKPLIVEPRTKNYSLVGIAFDYIFRFYLERLNRNITTAPKMWVAQYAPASNMNEMHKRSEIINTVRELKREYMETGILTRNLIGETLRMSYIDIYYRSRIGEEYIGTNADINDIIDLEGQYSILDEQSFQAKSICLLNPTFGDASHRVGGADADCLIDDKLVDIKSTKNLHLNLYDFCQIIGYFLLHKISGINGQKDVEINRLGLYYSRYGYLFLFNIFDIIDAKSLDQFVKWFKLKIWKK